MTFASVEKNSWIHLEILRNKERQQDTKTLIVIVEDLWFTPLDSSTRQCMQCHSLSLDTRAECNRGMCKPPVYIGQSRSGQLIIVYYGIALVVVKSTVLGDMEPMRCSMESNDHKNKPSTDQFIAIVHMLGPHQAKGMKHKGCIALHNHYTDTR